MSSRHAHQNEVPTPHSDDSRSEHFAKPLPSEKNAWWPNRNRKRTWIIAIACAILLAIALALGLGLGLGLKKKSKSYNRKGPNVLVIMTDDQDVLLESMSVMPNVKSMIGAEGVTYQKHYCTVALCCPSRVNFFTGRAAHNTNVTSLGLPYGGWQKFTQEGLNENYLPVWLNDAGIRTYYVGKFMNAYSKEMMSNPAHPKGWTDSSFLLDPWTYSYYDSHWTNGYTDVVTPYKGVHTTDVTQTKALAMIDEAAGSGDQFFMMVAPVAPHEEVTGGGPLPPPVPDKWKGKFADRVSPRTGNFNPDEPSGASWVRNLPKLTDKQVAAADKVHAHRLGNLAAIDDMVGEFIQKLDHHGILDNTYIIFTTDNGFHIGNHRLPPGKRCPYEEDINIPLLIRGPDVAKGVNSTITNSHTDMAPTILQMLGLPLRDEFDGAPIAHTEDALSSSNKSELINVEFWDFNFKPMALHKDSYYNNTYKALRLMSGNESLFYSTWCTGEREFYDMNQDYVQMNNRLAADPKGEALQYFGRSEDELISRLDALLMVTKSCKQDSCRVPWGTLFPAGQVTDLETAMNSQYDTFFANQPKVTFSECRSGYIVSAEGPQNVTAFKGP